MGFPENSITFRYRIFDAGNSQKKNLHISRIVKTFFSEFSMLQKKNYKGKPFSQSYS